MVENMSTAVQTRPLLSVRQVAEWLGVSEKQVYRLIYRGAIPAVRLGGRGSALRVDQDELEAWLYGQEGAA
jgi:excisionase family DNA binding protein